MDLEVLIAVMVATYQPLDRTRCSTGVAVSRLWHNLAIVTNIAACRYQEHYSTEQLRLSCHGQASVSGICL
jgi:hypothetical protein